MVQIPSEDFVSVTETVDGIFSVGENCVDKILQSRDKKIYLVNFSTNKQLMGVITRGTYVSYYPINKTALEHPIKAVLMDLDGTTLDSEHFWIHVIEETIRLVSNDVTFHTVEEDIPFVSGHSVSEHLEYCIGKYYPQLSFPEMMKAYYSVSRKELASLVSGTYRGSAIQPTPYLKEFLQYLSDRKIKVGLVTSGLYEKAYPEIKSVCALLQLGEPETVYDSIITAGYPLEEHVAGTLGELSSKPHPWLYLETATIGLHIPFEERSHILGIEDSGAGVCSLCAAGIPVVGMKNGNIINSGLSCLCNDVCSDLKEIIEKYIY